MKVTKKTSYIITLCLFSLAAVTCHDQIHPQGTSEIYSPKNSLISEVKEENLSLEDTPTEALSFKKSILLLYDLTVGSISEESKSEVSLATIPDEEAVDSLQNHSLKDNPTNSPCLDESISSLYDQAVGSTSEEDESEVSITTISDEEAVDSRQNLPLKDTPADSLYLDESISSLCDQAVDLISEEKKSEVSFTTISDKTAVDSLQNATQTAKQIPSKNEIPAKIDEPKLLRRSPSKRQFKMVLTPNVQKMNSKVNS